ncbi:MAG TPA: aldo/keto reductase [Actinomycetota bacterium]|nr:aldo/keto reductase [Actinomycetota bacterium]
MQTRRLGSSGPEISVVGFGAWEAGGDAWGPNDSEERVIEAIRAGLDAGITWIDTAEVYGDGMSERLVGRAVSDRRDRVVVATKVAPRPDGTGFRPDEVHRACRGSLERLGLDRIDLYQLHWTADDVPVEDTWGAMAELVDQGLVGAIGVSNFDRGLIERCEAIRHVDSLQPEFSMLQLKHREQIVWCGERGIGVVCYGPLAYGLLTGAITMETTFDPSDWRSGRQGQGGYYRALFARGRKERSLAVVDAMRPIADRLGITVAQLALAWTFQQPGVTSAIAGSRNPKHVRQNAEAGDVTLDEATLHELDALLPLGPAFV